MKQQAYTSQQLKASIAPPNWIVRRETRNDKSRASNPCQTRFEIFHYFRCYPLIPLASIPFSVVTVGIVGWVKHWDLWLIVSVAIGAIVIGLVTIITKQMKRFAVGDVNPGFVLDGSHIGVFVDLKASAREPRYAVKVVSAPLATMAQGAYRPGDRVPVTCLYFGPQDAAGAWQGVSAIPVAVGTTNPIALARVQASIPEQNWARAKTYVDQINSSVPKLHKLW